MNISTGHLVNHSWVIDKYGLAREAKSSDKKLEEVLFKDGYIEVPEYLENAAEKTLNGKSETIISLTSGGKLSKWARSERNKQKHLKKISEASRKKNRNR